MTMQRSTDDHRIRRRIRLTVALCALAAVAIYAGFILGQL
jgi:hypothetical protein